MNNLVGRIQQRDEEEGWSISCISLVSIGRISYDSLDRFSFFLAQYVSTSLSPISISLTEQIKVCDDAQQLRDTVSLFGVAVLTTLSSLKSHELLKPNSPIVNIPLIISLFLIFTNSWSSNSSGEGETDWTRVVIKFLDEAGIAFTPGFVARGTEKRVDSIREEMEDDDEDDLPLAAILELNDTIDHTWDPDEDYESEYGPRQWRMWDWKIEVCHFLHSFFSSSKAPKRTNSISLLKQ